MHYGKFLYWIHKKMTETKLYPLSLPQKAFYYDYLLNRDDCKYSMGGALILNGDLNLELYQKAYNYVITFYDAMRVRFIKKEEILYQQFLREQFCTINYADFRKHKNPVEDALEFMLTEYRKPLPIDSAHLYSEYVLQTDEKQFIFAPKFHHLIYDATGKSIINQAVADTYNCLLENGCYPEITRFSYIDFIEDDLQYRNSSLYQKSADFWKMKFANLPEPLSFTSKKKSIKNLSLHTERLTLNLHRVCFESIINIASDSNSTTFQVLLAIITITLNRCYKRNELVIGMPILNRSNHKFRNTPGLFLNMMALKLSANPEVTFEEVINSIKSEIREGYRHQRFPLIDIIKLLRANPEFKNELFDVTVVYRKNDFAQRFGQSRIKTITLDTEIRSESLSIEIDEYDNEENLNIFFNFNPQVISEDEITQFISCFETILIDLIHFPEKKIKDITYINEYNVYKLIHEFNFAPDKILTDKTIIGLFLETVNRNPDSIAVICNDAKISYKELNDRANQIAQYLLVNCNIKKEEIICLASEKNIEAIAAILGIMKTGAAYLPIDIEYPAERIKYIIENSGARILLRSGMHVPGIAEYVIDLKNISHQPTGNAEIEIRSNNLAYVIYTSGSTGKPKGVLIEHGQFMNMFVNMIEKFEIKKSDRVLQFASLGFDASVFEIFQALLTGAALVIADKEKILNPDLFVDYVNEKLVTFATLPPVYLKALNKEEFPHLNTLLTAGEQAVTSDVNFYKQFKRYINGYGPTEASCCVSYYIAEKDKDYSGSIPIGKPSPNSKIYILNEYLMPVPIGFQGEICVSGPSLARGYLNNNELTNQKFIINPFDNNSRLYRTGDLGSWGQDGNIQFLGRIDDQVKINGNRIELCEIEVRIAEYKNVKEVIVLDIIRSESKELAAFIVSDNKIDVTELKLFLRKFLPAFMIPLHYIFIDKIPVTKNSKIDKESLRRSALNVTKNEKTYSKASTEIEVSLIKMFEEILEVNKVGIDDNFFDLGGDSLKIARLVSKIHKELKYEINFKIIFDNPTVRSIADELTINELTAYEEIPNAQIKDFYPLSHAQKRLWILSHSKENPAVYHMPVSLYLEGSLNLNVLEKSIRIIIQRHESLRTVYTEINGNPSQKILNDYNLLFGNHDLSQIADNRNSAQILIKDRILTPFDLTEDLPIRVDFIKLGKDKHILLLVLHHIAGDGISIGIIMNEISGIYNSLINGNLINLKPLRIQYKDYSLYEKDLVESGKYDKEKDYWLRKLKKPLPILALDYDRNRPPLKTYSGEYLFFEIEKEVSEKLIEFSREQNTSLYVVLVSIMNILLHKYSSQEDIIIGSPVAGRNNPDLENQVGAYINTVIIRNKIKSSNRYHDFLEEVKSNVTEAISNSNYPFDRLIQNLNLERDTSRTPLFDVLVQYQNQNPVDLKLNGVTASFYKALFNLNKFDLTFTFVEEKKNISFSIGYNSGLFDRIRIERMARHIYNIISKIIVNPNCKINEFSLHDSGEKENLNYISQGKIVEFNDRKTIPELFENQVFKTPDNIALVFNDLKYTYKQLDERSNAVANEIRKRININPDDIIGIMTTRSDKMILGIMGILKAGAAYLPIDSMYPAERISFILNDCKVKLFLTESDLLELASKAAAKNNSISSDSIEILDLSLINNSELKKPQLNINGNNLAYVIYTSGSTGKPKGVMIEQRSLHNLVLGLSNEVYGDRNGHLNIALISPFVFDASVKQVFTSLLNGHCLDIVSEEIKTNGRKLIQFYEEHRIEVTDGTPSHLEIILEELKADKNRYLPGIFLIGGEQLIIQTVRKLIDIKGDMAPLIWNVYGPTECCDVSTCFKITPDLFVKQGIELNSLPIGKPLNNVQVYILDSSYNQVPIGISGELYIAGEGIARGYINSESLNAEKFIGLKIGKSNRVYKTGDIGRFLEDGNIVLSGRTDDQIKLRGYRIELHEIENCMRNFYNTLNTAVISIGEGNSLEIAAYYVCNEKIDKDDLAKYLSLYLPAYMLPSYLIGLEMFPLTSSGKVDKKMLPLPVKKMSLEVNSDLPKDFIEEKLCKIWIELLNISKISIHDNFFRVGGHSLTAIKLTSRIHKELNIELNIWEVFKNPTVDSLANLIRSKNPSFYSQIEKIKESEYYTLSHSQQRLWFLSKLDGHNSLYNLPGAFQLKGPVNVQILNDVLNAIVQRHESLRTYFVEIDGEPFQKIKDHIDFSIELSDLSGKELNDNTLNEIINDYFKREFDLSKVPLMQIKLIYISENNYYLLFNMHHIIGDGWSLEVMLKELKYYYNLFLNKKGEPLPLLRIQYKDYSSWQNEILSDKSLSSAKEYWSKKLCKPRPLLDLPSDYKRSDDFSIEGELIHYKLDENLVKKLIETSRKNNASLFMTLLSVIYILIHKYTGENDIIIGSPVAGREHYELENQIGFFINTIVLRNEINSEYTFCEVLNNVKETLSGALDNQIYPFDKLVDELDVERIRNRNPLFNVMVAWMITNAMEMKTEFSEIQISGVDFRISKSMFDLSFLFEENEGNISFAIEYNTSLFKRERIDRLYGHFTNLLENIIHYPEEKIKNIEIITIDEREKLLYDFNNTNRLLVSEKNVVELFNSQVQINKNRYALIYDENKITYYELDLLSNRIANQILEFITPGKDDIVAVIIKDVFLFAASMLAVMKSGAAYLPILPETPSKRISILLNDSNAKAVLVDSNIFTGTNITDRIIIDISGKISGEQTYANAKIDDGFLAYVIYTSGTTGLPKGVMIEHGSLTNLITSLNANIYSKYQNLLNELMISSFAFDVSIKQLFATLCNGNTLYILNNERKYDPKEIIKYITDNNINIVDFTPSLFSVIMEEGFGKIDKPDLREIFLGSEALPYKLVKDFYSYPGNKKINVTNFYGPTEACVESSFYKFNHNSIDENYEIAPIGCPIINEQIFILDENLKLCPIGIPGEIYIAGRGLARQYLNDSETTNEKFIDFPMLKNMRIYKTGDLGRISSEGIIEYLGRKDEQVKVRGYRVELQEIENQLRKMRNITDCSIIVIEKNGINDLAAYYSSGKIISPSSVRLHLEQYLPKYMIPSYYIQIDRIPVAANGKADKKLLPANLERIREIKNSEPLDEIDNQILQIICDVLNITNISPDDNYFEIGGHSLNAVRIVSRIRQELNVDLPLKEIFYNPVIYGIAEKVKNLINMNIPDEEIEHEKKIVPITEEELDLLSNLQVDDEE